MRSSLILSVALSLAGIALVGFAASAAGVDGCPSPIQTSSNVSVGIPGPEATATPSQAPSCSPAPSTPPGAPTSPTAPAANPPAGSPTGPGAGTPVRPGTRGGAGAPATSGPAAIPQGPPGAPVVGPKPAGDADALTLDPERVLAGDMITAVGRGYTAGEQVQVVLYSTPVVVGSFTADPEGGFRARFQAPEDLRSGTHTVEATGWDSAHIANADFTVVTVARVTGDAAVQPVWWIVGILGLIGLAVIIATVQFRRSIDRWLAPTGMPAPTPTVGAST